MGRRKVLGGVSYRLGVGRDVEVEWREYMERKWG